MKRSRRGPLKYLQLNESILILNGDEKGMKQQKSRDEQLEQKWQLELPKDLMSVIEVYFLKIRVVSGRMNAD